MIATTIPTYQITIAQKIKEYRKQNNLSQRNFAKLIGVSTQAVCKWEKQTCYPDITILPYLACVLGCSTDDFFEMIYKTPNPLQENCVYLSEHGGDNKNE